MCILGALGSDEEIMRNNVARGTICQNSNSRSLMGTIQLAKGSHRKHLIADAWIN